ncbi:MAG: 3-methyladenine DNA glycosylase [Myxococcales bacterium]|nr:3-methyladenine DNA glycosylase [Myxococcales bacterium]
MPCFSTDFYLEDPVHVAQKLLGAQIIHEHPEFGLLRGRIVETEAYRGTDDKACHASAGKTARTAPMFGPPGHAYVYLIYGMYDMFNVVTWPEGQAAAVLIRAIEPLEGIERTTNGPGRLTRALHITRDHNQQNLQSGSLVVEPDIEVSTEQIACSPRIGVDYAGTWAKKPWRFYVRDNPFVSKSPKRTTT